ENVRRAPSRRVRRSVACVSGGDVRDAAGRRRARLLGLSCSGAGFALRRHPRGSQRDRASRCVAECSTRARARAARGMALSFARCARRVGTASERRDGPPWRDGHDLAVGDRRARTRGAPMSRELRATLDELRARREIVRGPLAPLAASLAADLQPLLTTEPFIPPEKALLSRDG